jgi:transposase
MNMKIREGITDLVFLDLEGMFNYLIDLEDHLLHYMERHPEYDIRSILLADEDDIYTIRVIIDRYNNRDQDECFD